MLFSKSVNKPMTEQTKRVKKIESDLKLNIFLRGNAKLIRSEMNSLSSADH